jgi:L-gulonate 5-dehydrogenase
MKAAIIDAPRKMRVGDWPTPEPGPDQVLVRIRAAGICAGDMYIYLGKNPYATYPRIAGHELCGTIVRAGAKVGGIPKGTLVVVEPFIGCGKCYACRVGKSNCCANLGLIGTNLPGGYAEYVIAPMRNIHPVPQSLSPLSASFAEPLAIGVQACRRGDVKRGEYVLILGCGPIGMALIEVAKTRGANVVATDLSDSRLEFARTLGAQTLKADEHLLDNVLAQTNGEGAAVVIEATGNPKAMEQTVDLVASGGPGRERRPDRDCRPRQAGSEYRHPRSRHYAQRNDPCRFPGIGQLLPGSHQAPGQRQNTVSESGHGAEDVGCPGGV